MDDVDTEELLEPTKLDNFPEMEIVNEESDPEFDRMSAADFELADIMPGNLATPTKLPCSTTFSRARGLSFLPIRPGSAEPLLPVNPSYSYPPKSTAPLAPNSSGPKLKPAMTAEVSAVTPPRSQPITRASAGIALNTPSSIRPPSHLDVSPIPAVDKNQHLLNSYFSELASRESRISVLRERKAALEQELMEEELSMAQFKRNGAKLAQIVSNEHNTNPIKHEHARSESTSSGNSYSSNTSNDEPPADMFDAGRRVVAAMWSSLVKNAEPESRPIDHQVRHEPRHHPPSRSPHRSLTKKPLIAEFERPGSLSPSKQERREHAAQQALRSSQRLSKKLSQVNLRSPHQLGSESPIRQSPPPSPSRLATSRQKL